VCHASKPLMHIVSISTTGSVSRRNIAHEDTS
jgi:hypothetical protein